MKRLCLFALLVFLFTLSFHRPSLWDAFGPAAALPELLCPVAAAAALALRVRLERGALAPAVVLAVGFLPSVVFAMDQRRAAAQLCVLLYVAGIYALTRSLARNGYREAALLALALGAGLNVALGLGGALLDLMSVNSFDLAARFPWLPGSRPVGLTESPTMLALVALSGLFATLALRRLGVLGFPAVATLAGLFGAALVATQSRVTLAAIFAVCALQGTRRAPLRGAIAALCVLLTLISVRTAVVPLRGALPFINLSLGPYGVIQEIALRVFVSRPLTGVGLENFREAWPQFYDNERYGPAFLGPYAGLGGIAWDPHGTLVGYLAEAGVLALLVLGALGWLVWRGRARDLPESGAYVVGVALASFSADLLTERNTWALLGLLSFVPHAVASRSVAPGEPRRLAEDASAPLDPSPLTPAPSAPRREAER